MFFLLLNVNVPGVPAMAKVSAVASVPIALHVLSARDFSTGFGIPAVVAVPIVVPEDTISVPNLAD
jgi:hypothetical protein